MLPSIRVYARELGVSNTTIELAYHRLVNEGYIEAQHGRGYIVSRAFVPSALPLAPLSPAMQAELESLIEDEQAERESNQVDFDFWYDSVDATHFPFTTWARISRNVFL